MFEKRFIHVVSAADDAATYPVDNLLSISTSSDGQCELTFMGTTNDGSAASVDVVTLTITADTEDTVHQKIVELINARQGKFFINLVDDVDGVMAVSQIQSATITRDS